MGSRLGQGDPLPPGFSIDILDNDPDNPTIDYYFEKPAITPSKHDFKVIGELGNLFFFVYGSQNPHYKAVQIASFTEGVVIRVELSLVPKIVDYSTSSIEEFRYIDAKLRLCYKGPKSGKWTLFERQIEDEDNKILEVKFNFWHR